MRPPADAFRPKKAVDLRVQCDNDMVYKMLILYCLLTYTLLAECTRYPVPNDKYYAALPNSGHASIQYGPNDQEGVVDRHYSQNGYDTYPSIGVKDVVHSVGTLLDIIQTFPK